MNQTVDLSLKQRMIIVLGHYRPVEGNSMALYRELITNGLTSRGHKVVVATAPVLFQKLARVLNRESKWLGYIDQFLIFPFLLSIWQLTWPTGTKVIVLDQALGPWVPFIRGRPILIICHDLLALRASRGEFPEQRISFTGKLYQRLIRWGFRHGRYFAAVSNASYKDLENELKDKTASISILLNPLPEGIYPIEVNKARLIASSLDRQLKDSKYVLHVGGYWYKNREGVCRVFLELLDTHPELKLVLVGHIETAAQMTISHNSKLKASIIQLSGITTEDLNALYSAAEVLLFPSWYEGFGWPVLEALACGCPVITTNRNPMIEVGGDAANYISACPHDLRQADIWAKDVSKICCEILNRSEIERAEWRRRAMSQTAKFDKTIWLNKLELIISKLA
jgi:glycosyltransferase involved in cell wall biosynthesis